MESGRYPYRPPEYNNPEEPFGQGTLETNSTGDIETTNDNEKKDRHAALIKLLIRVLQVLKANDLLRAVLAILAKNK